MKDKIVEEIMFQLLQGEESSGYPLQVNEQDVRRAVGNSDISGIDRGNLEDFGSFFVDVSLYEYGENPSSVDELIDTIEQAVELTTRGNDW